MDKVIIKNMVFSGYHGCEDYEKTNQQPFNIDIEIKLDLTNPMKSDKLETTVDYSAVYELVREIVEDNSFLGQLLSLLKTHNIDIVANSSLNISGDPTCLDMIDGLMVCAITPLEYLFTDLGLYRKIF